MLPMSMRALSFGDAADAYERFRPGYPDEVYRAVREYAGEPPRTALEIGAGTGKATRLFTGHGVRVTATEPDAAMLAELVKAVPAIAHAVQAAFEDLDDVEDLDGDDGDGVDDGHENKRVDGVRSAGTYDLVYVAAALHWTRPEGRWQRVAALLRPGGVFANFAGPVELADPAVAQAVRAARAPFIENDDIPSPDGTAPEAPMQWPGTELRQSELFHDVRQIVIERRLTLTAREYLGHLSTISAYLQLPEAVREQAYAAIAKVLPESVELAADVYLHLARRSD